MRERKPYPNISDEELDRRAEEALKRMLANPKNQGLVGGAASSGHGQNHGQGQGGQGHGQGGQGPGHNPNNQNRQGRRKRRNRPQRQG